MSDGERGRGSEGGPAGGAEPDGDLVPDGAPGWLLNLLGRFLPRGERVELRRELDDLFRRRVRLHGRRWATLWLVRSALAFPVRLGGAWVGGAMHAVGRGVASVGADLRYGARVLRRRPGYSLACIATLGIGLGGVATVYGAANWVLLRPVPGILDDRGLVSVRMELGESSPAFPLSQPDLVSLRDRVPVLSELEASGAVEVHLRLADSEEPRRLEAAVVSDRYFEVLRVGTELGRLPGDEPGTVVISERLWREGWELSPRALGATVRVNGVPHTVVGILARGFRGAELPGGTDVWLPASAWSVANPELPLDVLSSRGSAIWTEMIGRLVTGGAPEDVQAQARTALEDIRDVVAWPHSFAADFRVQAYPGLGLSPRIRSTVERMLLFMGGTAALLLLLALANVTNLALAHGIARSDTLAVHAALGAGRRGTVQKILVEQVLLGVCGGAVGVGFAFLVTRFFQGASLSPLGASLEGLQLEPRVFWFTAVVAVVAAVAAGLGPAVIAGRGARVGLPGSSRLGHRRTFRVQSGLVVVQIAVSAVLIVGAGLLTRSVLNLRAVDLGFEPDRAVRFSIDPRVSGYDDEAVRDLIRRLDGDLGSVPAVQSVGFVAPKLVDGSRFTLSLAPEGSVYEERSEVFGQFQATAGFLPTIGARFLAGSPYPADARGVGSGVAEVPVVITRGVAEAMYPGRPAEGVIGQRLSTRGGEWTARVAGVVEDIELVGVVDSRPLVFLPWEDGYGFEVAGWVRTQSAPESILAPVRAAALSASGELPVYELRSVRSQVDRLITEERVVARLALGLACVGMFLTFIGLEGVLAYMVAQRRREIGVRKALGASSSSIAGRLVRSGLILTVMGAGIGAVGIGASNRFLESRLFGVTPLEADVYLIGVALLLATTAGAVWRSARRSLSISPLEALKEE